MNATPEWLMFGGFLLVVSILGILLGEYMKKLERAEEEHERAIAERRERKERRFEAMEERRSESVRRRAEKAGL